MEITETIKLQIEQLEKSDQFAAEFINFYQQLLLLQHQSKKLINKEKLSLLASSVDLEQRLVAGRPLVETTNFYIDQQFAAAMVHDLTTVLRQSRPKEQAETIVAFEAALSQNKVNLVDFLKNFIGEERGYFQELEQSFHINFELLIFMARTIAQPLLEVHRQVLQPDTQQMAEHWSRPFCPTCGSVAAMARLEKEVGQKILWCSVCNSQWNFQRLQCPFCLNAEQSQLRYFFIQETSPYRVDVCDKCKHYIKTVDERKLSGARDIFMNIEDLLSLNLDHQAEAEGYVSAHWWQKNDDRPCCC